MPEGPQPHPTHPSSPASPAPIPLTALEGEVAVQLRPSAEELAALASAREALVALAEEEARKRDLPLKRALVAGSAARETYLPPSGGGRLDLDLFLLFDPKLPREQLTTLGLALAHALLESPQKRYAEHPYLRGLFRGFAVDAVPGYQVERSDRPQTAVDRTPFHHAYLAPHLNPRMRDDVRLLKRLLKTLEVYGADTRTEGFSGYLVELLIVRYGSFGALLREARSWRLPQRLCPPGPEPSVTDDVALVLPDPVDPHRNVASALSRRNFALFLMAVEAYGQRPRREFFFPPARPPRDFPTLQEESRHRESHVVLMAFPAPDLVDDILYPQLRKCERALAAPLERWGFGVLGTSSARVGEQAAVAVEIDRRTLGATSLHAGPPVGSKEVPRYLERWTPDAPQRLSGPYLTVEGRLQVDLQRSVRDALLLLQRELPQMGFGKSLQQTVTGSARFSYLADAEPSPAITEALRGLYARQLPWALWP